MGLSFGVEDEACPHLAFEQDVIVTFPERGLSTFVDVADLSIRSDKTDSKQVGVWVFHSATGLRGIILDGVTAVVNDRQVVGLSVLHDRDEILIGDHHGFYVEVVSVRIGEAAASLPECLFCKSRFVADDYVARCPLCEFTYHSDCWEELQGKRCCSPHCAFIP